MESGDLLTIAGALVLVLVIAAFANPHYLGDVQMILPGTAPDSAVTLPVTVMVSPPAPVTIPPVTATSSATPPASASPVTPAPPLRILYTDKPFTYPAVLLPENPDTYGESDIRRSGQDVVTFAYVEESRGGLTRVFTIPYPVWNMDIRVTDTATPNTGTFRMALCYAANGTIIDGVEIEHPGTAYRKVQTSDTPLYLIVSAVSIETYRIDLQTSRQYFEQYGPMKAVP